ncbi:MAG: hypothetical protein PUE95_12455 [Lachnospiraceae bacterium]|nr:hypothetical protein [Lachnospiraceae bacterium]
MMITIHFTNSLIYDIPKKNPVLCQTKCSLSFQRPLAPQAIASLKDYEKKKASRQS